MTVKERILMLRLLDKSKSNAQYLEEIGVATSISRGDSYQSTENRQTNKEGREYGN